MDLRSVRGTKDLLGEDYDIHSYITSTVEKISTKYGIKGISTPILEYTNLFTRSLGETSDVVHKEMYTFQDKSNNSVTLRPEFTAGIMRSILTKKLLHNLPLRLFSHGPLFRYDRPQAGRYRQFHQINFEYIGLSGACYDAELICLGQEILEKLNIADKVSLEINSLGCTESRNQYHQALFEYFSEYKNHLSKISKERLNTNPLRILDSKEPEDQNIIENTPDIALFYTDESKQYFEDVLQYLDLLKIKYKVNKQLVRGLDYYSHTTFEFTTTELGSQSAVLAGGRYDGLSSMLGGPNVPAVGFAGGIERISLLMNFAPNTTSPIVIIPVDEDAFHVGFLLSQKLRNAGLYTLIEHNNKIATSLRKASKYNAKYVVFIGEEEMKVEKYKIKELSSSQESFVTYNELLKKIKK